MRKIKGLSAAVVCLAMVAAAGIPALAADRPSQWAANQVNAAIAEGLVPAALQSRYTQTATRAEFCALAVAVYEAVKGGITGRTTFTDTRDVSVEKAASVGIVSGVAPGRFDPSGRLTREMAAAMLSNLANAAGQPLPQRPATFADNAGISPWAFVSVGRVQAAGIMTGVTADLFGPKQPYTREQSIVTILRLFEILRSGAGAGNGNQGSYIDTPIVAPSYEVQYIRTDNFGDYTSSPSVTVISSRSELEQYGAYPGAVRSGMYNSNAERFINAIQKYTDVFFQSKYLVIVSVVETSGSISHNVESIAENGNIIIRRSVPEIGTSDMAQWEIIIELDASFKPGQFSAVFNDG